MDTAIEAAADAKSLGSSYSELDTNSVQPSATQGRVRYYASGHEASNKK